MLGFFIRAGIDAGVETQHDALGRAGEVHVGLGDGAHRVMHNVEGDLLALNLLEGFNDGLHGTLGVGFDHHLEGELLVLGDLGKKIFERDAGLTSLGLGGLLGHGAFLGDVARRLFVLDDGKLLARLRHSVQAQHPDSDGRRGLLQSLALLVDERADAAIMRAAKDDVADAERALAHQDGGGGTARLQTRFNDVALGLAVRVGFQLKKVGLEDNHLQELVNALLGECRTIHEKSGAAPFVGCEAFFLQLLTDAKWVRVGVIALVDGDQDGNLCGLCVGQRLQCLRHDAVVRCDDEDDNVRDVGAARTHGRECSVAGVSRKVIWASSPFFSGWGTAMV